MTRLGKQTDPVRPSVPDPVDAWLDVLVTMLAIPRADRQTVRDELEDHLRSRIDDLLIHGLSEPQALEKAVAELGETADLARQLSHAHKPPRTRRYAMHALIIALAGTVVALGVNQVRPNAAATIPNAAIAVASPAPAASSDRPIPVRDRTVGDVLEAFKEQIDRPVMIHWTSLQDIGLERDAPIEIDSDPLRFGMILQLLAERTEPALQNSIAILDTPELVEIGLRSQFDQRTLQRQLYDASVLMGYGAVSPASRERAQNPRRAELGSSFSVSEGARGVASLLETHISPNDWVNQGGSLAQYSVMGTTIIVTAPERIQREIAAMIEELSRGQRQAEEAGMQSARQQVESLESSFNELESEYGRLFSEWESLTTEGMSDSSQPGSQAGRLEVVEFKRRDLMERMQFVRIRQSSIRSAKDQLIREWGLQSESFSAVNTGSVLIGEGDVADYVRFFLLDSTSPVWIPVSPSSGLKLSQVLAGQGFSGNELQTHYVYIQPAGKPDSEFIRTTVQSVLSSPNSDRQLSGGDRVQVLNRFIPASQSQRAP